MLKACNLFRPEERLLLRSTGHDVGVERHNHVAQTLTVFCQADDTLIHFFIFNEAPLAEYRNNGDMFASNELLVFEYSGAGDNRFVYPATLNLALCNFDKSTISGRR